MKQKILLAAFFLLASVGARAQFGPNLTAGSEGLVFNQGQLDAQLIMSIIATKRGEIKKEMGKRLILDKLSGGSYAFYSYAEKNLNVLFNETNKSVITKEFMQNSAELLLVYGLAEYMLQDIRERGEQHKGYDAPTRNLLIRLCLESDSANRNKLANIFNLSFTAINRVERLNDTLRNIYLRIDQLKKDAALKDLSPERKKELDAARAAELKRKKVLEHLKDSMTAQVAAHFGTEQDVERNEVLELSASVSAHTEMANYLLKPEITTYLVNRDNKKYNEPRNNYYSAMSMFVDMIYDACINNPYVVSTGMFQSENRGSVRYKALSKYWFFETQHPKIFKDLKGFQPKVDSVLSYLFQYYQVFKEYRNLSGTGMSGLFSTIAKDTSSDVAKAERLIAAVKDDMLAVTSKDNSLSSAQIYKDKLDLQKRLLNMPLYLKQARRESSDTVTYFPKYNLDLAYTFQKEILPQLSTLNGMQAGGVYTDVIRRSDSAFKQLQRTAYYYMMKDTSGIRRNIYELKNYIPLLEVLNNLDRVESYDYMFKFLTEVSETYSDSRSKMVARILTNSVDRYSALNKENNKMSIDVEGMARDIFNRFAQNQHARVSPFFTVGISHNTLVGNGFHFQGSDVWDSASQQSVFASEKIGLKWNMLDFNRKRSFNQYNLYKRTAVGDKIPFNRSFAKARQNRAAKIGQDPMINNLHMIVFASGILYQIKALNSADQFNTPILGTGFGITFFNGLDLNVSYALPVTFDTDESFMSVSFDIALFEYLGALKKK